jgi:hypothetical protein
MHVVVLSMAIPRVIRIKFAPFLEVEELFNPGKLFKNSQEEQPEIAEKVLLLIYIFSIVKKSYRLKMKIPSYIFYKELK